MSDSLEPSSRLREAERNLDAAQAERDDAGTKLETAEKQLRRAEAEDEHMSTLTDFESARESAQTADANSVWANLMASRSGSASDKAAAKAARAAAREAHRKKREAHSATQRTAANLISATDRALGKR